MKKSFNLQFLAIVITMLFTFSACRKNAVDQPAPGLTLQSVNLPGKVKEQLSASGQALASYMPDLKMTGFREAGAISTEAQRTQAIELLAAPTTYMAYGNLKEAGSVTINTIGNLAGPALMEGRSILRQSAIQELKLGDKIVYIQWQQGNKTFETPCIYNNNGIVWDNILTGVYVMDAQPVVERSDVETVNVNGRAIVGKWESNTWTVNWIFGSKRGQMVEKITIYYDNVTRRVSSTDRYDDAYINIGSAKSESKILVNSGSYGKIQYALGVATPLASVSMNWTNFKVEVSGIGSNSTHNGTHTLYP